MLHFTQTAVLTQISVFNRYSWNASNLYTVFLMKSIFTQKYSKHNPQRQSSHLISNENKLENDNTAAYFLQKPLKDRINSWCIKCLLFYGPIMQLETCCNLLQSTRLVRAWNDVFMFCECENVKMLNILFTWRTCLLLSTNFCKSNTLLQ